MDVCPSDGPVTFEALITQRCNVLVSLVIRRAALFDAGLFDASLRSVEDFDLWARLLARGSVAVHGNGTLVKRNGTTMFGRSVPVNTSRTGSPCPGSRWNTAFATVRTR